MKSGSCQLNPKPFAKASVVPTEDRPSHLTCRAFFLFFLCRLKLWELASTGHSYLWLSTVTAALSAGPRVGKLSRNEWRGGRQNFFYTRLLSQVYNVKFFRKEVSKFLGTAIIVPRQCFAIPKTKFHKVSASFSPTCISPTENCCAHKATESAGPGSICLSMPRPVATRDIVESRHGERRKPLRTCRSMFHPNVVAYILHRGATQSIGIITMRKKSHKAHIIFLAASKHVTKLLAIGWQQNCRREKLRRKKSLAFPNHSFLSGRRT